jgi:hypothetical protein
MNAYGSKPSSLAVICTVISLAIGLFSSPAYPRFGGFGRAGGGFRMGGDGFAGGNPSYTAWSHPDYSSHSYGSSYYGYHPNSSNFQNFHSTNQTARYNEANSINQTRYNEAQSMQNQHYQNESAARSDFNPGQWYELLLSERDLL